MSPKSRVDAVAAAELGAHFCVDDFDAYIDKVRRTHGEAEAKDQLRMMRVRARVFLAMYDAAVKFDHQGDEET